MMVFIYGRQEFFEVQDEISQKIVEKLEHELISYMKHQPIV